MQKNLSGWTMNPEQTKTDKQTKKTVIDFKFWYYVDIDISKNLYVH